MPQALNAIEISHGNTIVIPFRLRLKGKRDPFDVSAATAIRLDIRNPSGVNRPPLTADRNHPLADWAKGRVPVMVTPDDVTGMIGTWEAVVTVTLENEVISAPSKGSILIEVNRRPGYPQPTP